ncbi:MAG: ABC transporter permease subunit [Paracoccaceae bacterium]|jgi:general L-amino acid transport system permease protein|nr:MAG: amino acid ABC transporter permease [Rhodobacter sp. BACL10 MAG-121220-bin24]MDO7632914.1 ABC transporter permease subunit [Paracoccaceae bacterium]HAQ47238.1 amino acid ABC transporter permease [Rhodobacter sp.]MDO7659199.1 ABC transporter permease subunit [Paracoccaceae bacterium]MDP5331912.1 ABC transporter permease subunit [Paracoccaceae bacterium]
MAFTQSAEFQQFKLSQLIYDTRFRSYTIQLFVLIIVLAALYWLLGNVVDNLAAKDKDINFAYLFVRAGYDIDQQLISYTNDSTHLRASIIGLLNTLVLAFAGCVLATIVGLIAGILRLSKNWIVSRLIGVYVEVFRNVPLLLWIIVSLVFFSETRPQPRDFRVTAEMAASGQEPIAKMMFNNSVAITNRSNNIPSVQFTNDLGVIDLGFVSVSVLFLATVFILVASYFTNRFVLRTATKVQWDTGVRPTTWWKSLSIWFLPLGIFFWSMGLYLDYPVLGGFNFKGGLIISQAFMSMLVALTLYTGAFIAEAVRAGILAISRGQTEAAYALGVTPSLTTRLIILPQALRVIIPPLISQYLNLTKNTSLGIAVGYLDLNGTLGGITLNQTGRELECMVLMMSTYLVLSLIISSIMNIYNASVKLKER